MVMTYNAHAGEDTKLICPHLKYFKWKENPMWYKVSNCGKLTN